MRGEREVRLCRTTLFNGRLATSCDVRAGVWESFSAGLFKASGTSPGTSRRSPLEVTESLFLSQQKEVEKELGQLINSFICGDETSVSMLFEESQERIAFGPVSDERRCSFLRFIVRTKGMPHFVQDRVLRERTLDELLAAASGVIRRAALDKKKRSNLRCAGSVTSKMPVLFCEDAACFLAHEILGHCLENDNYRLLSQDREIRLDPSLIVEDSIEGVEEAIGLNRLDDAGSPVKPVTLVRDGGIVGRMALASGAGVELGGFARAQAYNAPSMPRMRMTRVRFKGSSGSLSSFPKIAVIARVSHGFLDLSQGSYHLMGTVYLVEDGHIVRVIPSASVTGSIEDAFSEVLYHGTRPYELFSDCFKNGQTVRVGCSSPSLLLAGQQCKGVGYVSEA